MLLHLSILFIFAHRAITFPRFGIEVHNFYWLVLRFLVVFGLWLGKQTLTEELEVHLLFLQQGSFLVWQIELFACQEVEKIKQLCFWEEELVGFLENSNIKFFHLHSLLFNREDLSIQNLYIVCMITRIRHSGRIIRLFSTESVQRQVMEYDVLVVGAGVAGLSTAIKIKQLSSQYERPLSICVIEKGTEVGDHILSGNCFETRAFDELFPKWRQLEQQKRPPIDTPVTEDHFKVLLNEKSSISVPHFLFPKTIKNHGNYIISLSKLTKWMGDHATELGVDIFPGTPGADVLYGEDGSVDGVITGDFGISKKGDPKENYQPGIEIKAKQTVLAEGCRGSLSEKIIERFRLRDNSSKPNYGIGLKQVWEVNNSHFKPGLIQHTVGWPLQSDVYGGSFLYHMKPNIIHVGLVVGLGYQNPYLNPYEQFQRMKLHPQIRKYLEGGQCLSYGARALNSQGYFSIPNLVFPGGVLVGCSAGFMNVLKIKGSHNAIKSGVEAGKAIYEKLTQPERQHEHPRRVDQYEIGMKKSWVWKELYESRNFKNSFFNLYSGLAYGGLFKFLRGKQPFDLRVNYRDCDRTEPKQKFKPIKYPKHDRKLTFDLLQNLARSGTNHEHDQPSHLVVKSGMEEKPNESLNVYGGPEQRFCPARVYEFVEGEDGKKKLQINAQNCLHCKTCSIKMIGEYIEWKTPEGNGGPKYNLM